MPTIEQLTKLLAAEPDDVFLNFGLAMEYVKTDRLEDAFGQFERVLQLDPKYPAAYYHWAKALIAAGRHAEARVLLRKGVDVAAAVGDHHARSEMMELVEAIPE